MIQHAFTLFRRLFPARPSKLRSRRNPRLFQPEALESRQLLAVTAIQAFHRSGQTFVNWNEDAAVVGEEFHVYRSTSPITTANLSGAEKLTSKWGPLDDNTSRTTRVGAEGVPANLVINDLAAPLADSKGLFVFTTPENGAGTFYYAVTQLTNGVENQTITPGTNALSAGVLETVATPKPVLTVSNASGKGRIYTQFMDYAKWNPTFQGYSYHYSVALPDAYNPNVAWPVRLMPHAYGDRMQMEQSAEYGWPFIEVFPDDPGGGIPGDYFQTWWYGFAADHNYRTGGPFPTSGRIENFTEQRILKTIDEVSSMFNVDPLRIHAQGHSMGASGALSLGMRYGNVFSGIFASEPMTNYASSPLFQTDFSVLWGSQSANLPVVNNGIHAAHLQSYNGTSVYEWMNHHQQLTNRRGEQMAFLMVGHGKADDVIDWATQGRPFIAALNAGNVGFTAEQRFGWGHNWMSFDFAVKSMFSPSSDGLDDWVYPRNVSFPGITNATGSGPGVPQSTGTDFYNMQFEWSVPWNQFDTNIIDTASRYEITLRSTNGNQVAEVTPQRLQAFRTPAGISVAWQNVNTATSAVVQSGTIVADADGLVTLPRVQIGTGTGNRLKLSIITPSPVLTGPSVTTQSQTPEITWSAVSGAISYDVWITNLSTGQAPALLTNVTTSSFTPASPLGIGRYRVFVRSRFSGGLVSTWSAAREFRINTAPVIDAQPGPVYSGTPLLTWSSVPGALKYELWINNKTTGQTEVVHQTNLTTNSFQITQNLGLGVYQAWVRGIDAAGTAGDWSAAREFTSAARTRQTGPNAPTFNPRPAFRWAALSGASKYEVSVQNRTTNAYVISQADITTTSWTPASALANGDYRWWVRASGASGIVGGWSGPMEFNIGGKPTVLTPIGTTSDQTPTITWTAVVGAVRYELWVSRLDGGGVVIDLTNLTNNEYTPTTDLAPRAYRIWVRAVSAAGVISLWSAPVDVTVTDLKILPSTLRDVLPLGLPDDDFGAIFDDPAVAGFVPANHMVDANRITEDFPDSTAPETIAETDAVSAFWSVVSDSRPGVFSEESW